MNILIIRRTFLVRGWAEFDFEEIQKTILDTTDNYVSLFKETQQKIVLSQAIN